MPRQLVKFFNQKHFLFYKVLTLNQYTQWHCTRQVWKRHSGKLLLKKQHKHPWSSHTIIWKQEAISWHSQTPAISITNNHNVNCDNYCASSVFCNLSSPNLHGTLLRKEYYTHDPFQIASVQIACLCLLTIDPTKHFENVNYRGHLKLLQTHECLENFISDIPQSHTKMVVR